MDLKQFLSKGGKSSNEYFWALVIEPGWVQAGIWRINEEEALVVSSAHPTAWELEEDLVSATDTALSVALQNSPEEEEEPSKTVFGLASSWVSGGQIKPEYLAKIKKICSELSLTPVGFVVIPEAMAHYLKSEEGSPTNAVVLGVYKEVVEISVFKLGNLLGTTQVGRSVSIVDDVCEGLSRFTDSEAIPSRFILYNGKEGELEETKQALLKVNWDDFNNLKFLHTPKVETISSERKVFAVCLAGASELADVISIKAVEPRVAEEKEEERIDEEISEEVSAEELGFELERDIAEKKEEPGSQEPLEEKEDYSIDNVVPVELEASKKQPSFKEAAVPALVKIASFVKDTLKKTKRLPEAGVKNGLPAVGKKSFLFGLGFFATILIVGFVSWWLFPKATVSIYISPTKLEERIDIVIDPEASVPNLAEKILPADELKTNVSGEKTKSTTGTKTVGEKAKGEATLYRVGPQISLPLGTILYGPDSLKFSLEKEAAVASGSASSPGTTKTSLTAEDIGAQYNLATGVSFKVGNFSTSDIEAKNEVAFSGGSSREISAVSADDQKVLQKELEGELEEKAARDLAQGLSEEKIFIPESLTATASSKTFSNKVGDEATNLKLSLTIDAQAFAVEKGQLMALAQGQLSQKVPGGFVLREEQISVEFGSRKEEGGVYKFSSVIEANLLPEIDVKTVAKKIAGKYPQIAEEYLTKEVAGFVRAEIKLRPRLPGRLGILPRMTRNIDIEISAER